MVTDVLEQEIKNGLQNRWRYISEARQRWIASDEKSLVCRLQTTIKKVTCQELLK